MDVLEQEQNTGEKAAKEGPADYGEGFKKLPERLQGKLRDLVRKAQERDHYARWQEIKRTQRNRFFELGIQHYVWDQDLGIFQVGQQGGGIQDDAGDEGPLFQRDIQNYLGYEKSFRSVFCQPAAPVRFEPEDPKEGIDITAAAEADKMKRVIEKFNDPKKLQDDAGRYLWTDGSVIAHTRFIRDGQRFGYEEEDDEAATFAGGNDQAAASANDGGHNPAAVGILPAGGAEIAGEAGTADNGTDQSTNEVPPREPKGREVIDMYGVLECKRPLSIRNMHRWPYLIISTEDDIAIAKAEQKHVEEKITAGAKPHGAENYARLARIVCSQGASWQATGGASTQFLVTVDRCWFRPSWFTELGNSDDAERKELEELFPDGCHVVFIGDVYCESRNESMDDHIKVLNALRGNGQAIPGLGNSLVDPCEAFDDMFNMSEEAFKFCIPAKIFRNKILDLEAINEQQAQYGGYYEANPDPQPEKPFADNFFEETPVEPPAQMAEMMIQTQGPLMQFLSGQLAPLMGASDEHNETAKGISILRDQALGLMSLIWTPFTVFYGEVMLDAVRCAAENRDEDKPFSTLVDVPGKKGKQEPIEIDIAGLKGNILCSPVVDSNFPESWSAKSNRFFQLFSQAGTNPLLAQLLAHPDNRALAKDMLGLVDFEDPAADAREKQIQEIAKLSKAAPIPPGEEELQAAAAQELDKFKQAQQLQAAGQAVGLQLPPAQPPDPQQLMAKLTQQLTKSSVEVDPICDDHATEKEECLRWINSPVGQKAKYSADENDRAGYMNVRLHMLEHDQALKAMQAAMAPPLPAPGPAGPGGPGAVPHKGAAPPPPPQVGGAPQTGAIQ